MLMGAGPNPISCYLQIFLPSILHFFFSLIMQAMGVANSMMPAHYRYRYRNRNRPCNFPQHNGDIRADANKEKKRDWLKCGLCVVKGIAPLNW